MLCDSLISVFCSPCCLNALGVQGLGACLHGVKERVLGCIRPVSWANNKFYCLDAARCLFLILLEFCAVRTVTLNLKHYTLNPKPFLVELQGLGPQMF